MEITFLGHSSFKIKGKNATVITDPYSSEMTKLKFPKLEADVVTVSHNHEDHNQVDQVDGNPYIANNPGEYEIKGVSLIGTASFHDNAGGIERGKNTIFVIEIDKVRICHLGDLGHKLNEEELEELDGVDILMIPVGGDATIGPSEAVQIINQIEPKMIIPMHFQEEGLNPEIFGKLAPLTSFLKEMGESPEALPKLSITADLLPEDKKVVVLERKNG
jgi:L-ascorbate metabolism protein UlaG (beta-lactamase superfamily)